MKARILCLLAIALVIPCLSQSPADAAKIHRDAIVIDAHCDTALRLIRGETTTICTESQSGHIDIPRLAKGGVDAEFFAIFVNPSITGDEGVNRVRRMIQLVKQMVESCPDKIGLATTAGEIRKLTSEGKIAALLGLEGGHVIQGNIDILKEFYGLGVRYMTLTWSNSNDFADSSDGEKKWNGLNPLGKRIVREMNRMGMIVDVSHVSDKTFWDVIEISTAPVIASHSSCRALRDIPRNMTDDMIKAVAKKGGVVCINFYPRFLADTGKEGSAEEKNVPVSVLIDHIDHAIRVAGVDHVGLGSDFDGITAVPKGMKDVTGMPLITEGLLNRGYKPEEVKKVLGGNLLRVIREVTGK